MTKILEAMKEVRLWVYIVLTVMVTQAGAALDPLGLIHEAGKEAGESAVLNTEENAKKVSSNIVDAINNHVEHIEAAKAIHNMDTEAQQKQIKKLKEDLQEQALMIDALHSLLKQKFGSRTVQYYLEHASVAKEVVEPPLTLVVGGAKTSAPLKRLPLKYEKLLKVE